MAGVDAVLYFTEALERAARQAEGRSGVLVSADDSGRMSARPSVSVPRRQIWTSWGTKVVMVKGWPDA